MIDVAGRYIAATVLLAALVLVWAGPALAHTGFESSDPPDGAIVVEPVSEVVVRFSGPATSTGEGFIVRLPTGDLIEPAVVAEDGETSWRLELPEPIVDGVVAVRWEVKAPDAHPIAGSFSFTVAAAAAEPDREVVTSRTVTDREESVGSEVSSAPDQGRATDAEAAATASVEEFLAKPEAGSTSVSLLGYVGRLLGLGGTIAAIGLLMFATLVLVAGDPERAWLLRSCGPIGLLLVVAAVLELTAQTVGTGAWSGALETAQWGSVIQSNAGIAILLRLVGGMVLILGARSVLVHSVGVGLLLAVVIFDGHTATSGQRVMTAVVDVVHVFAGAVWAGGVFGLAAVLISRHRRGVALDGLRLGLRFSRIAALASALAGVAGVALAFIVLESFDQLIGSPWGRVLIAKVLLVAVAASIGSYNHFVVLRSAPVDQTQSTAVSARLRRLVAVEAAVLITVVAVTALLIASSLAV